MARWAVLVQMPAQHNERDRIAVLAEFEGTREQAEAEMLRQVDGYHPRRPVTPRGSVVYRVPEGWLMLVRGAFNRDYPYRFTLAEEYRRTR